MIPLPRCRDFVQDEIEGEPFDFECYSKIQNSVSVAFLAGMDRRRLAKNVKAAVEINTADKNAFIKASGAIYEEFGKSVAGGAELVKTAQALGEIY